MIEKVKGDIFELKCDAIVNPVNTAGFMGKGLSLQYKNKYPENFKNYKQKCSNKEFDIGDILDYKENGKLIINVPTKRSYQHKSKIEYIEIGLDLLREFVINNKINSLALPYIGCGLGQLPKEKVENLINEKLGNIDNTKIILVDN